MITLKQSVGVVALFATANTILPTNTSEPEWQGLPALLLHFFQPEQADHGLGLEKQGCTQCCSLSMNLITLPWYAYHTEGKSWRGKLEH